MKRERRFVLSTTHIILLSFLGAILIGSGLLSLPISSADGRAVPYIDALFTSTTATCVTGLVTLPVVSTWSVFGQAVILVLIQIGGLGIITVMSGVMIALHRKMSLSDRLLIQDAFNLNTLAGLAAFIKRVIFGTLLVEGIGALICMAVFIPDFGLRGIWISIFHSVSAFCNAGIDIISENSLSEYVTNPLLNLTTCGLIIMGGIGYIVWWDVLRVFKGARVRRYKMFRYLTLHSKLAITTTLILIFVGAGWILLFEYNNPLTIGTMSLFDKLQVSLFQSVTTRTAGFASIGQQYLRTPTAMISMLLMFIGGSPVGTAGGIKTVTLTVLIAETISAVKKKRQVSLFHRTLSREVLSKAVAVTGVSFLIFFVATVLLSATVDANILDVLYETVSATATVGLTRGLTATLNLWGKLIVIVTMYLGRVGPISLALALNITKDSQNIIKDPMESISVG